MASTPNPRERVTSLLRTKTDLDDAQRVELERAVYNWSLQYADANGVFKTWNNPLFVSLYAEKARSVISNLDVNSYVGNLRLSKRLQDKEFQPREIPFMKPDHTCPEVWQPIMELKMKKDECIGAVEMTANTNMFKCSRCHSREVYYIEKQLRSADEPMSLISRCLNCGHRWRM
jgi:DNA-directed RNA polymerase subunit M/transcription elongation factor TFIIS